MKLRVFSAAFALVVSHVPRAPPRHIRAPGSVPGFLAASIRGDRQTPQRAAEWLYDWVSLGADNAGLG